MPHEAQIQTSCARSHAARGHKRLRNIALVVNWKSFRALLMIATIHGMPSQLIDFVLAFPQANLEVDVVMGLLVGM